MRRTLVALVAAVTLAALPMSAPQAAPQGKKVAFLVLMVSLAYTATLAKTITEEGKKHGIEVTSFSSPFDPAMQSQQMDDAIARKFDMVVLMAASETAIIPAVTRAKQANMPVIAVIGQPKAGSEKLYTSFVGDDQPELGRIAARSMLEALKKSGRDGGKIAAVTGSLQEGVAPLRLDQFKATIKQNPKVELVAVEDVAWDTAKSEQVTGQLLARFAPQGGLAGIYGMADNMAVAVIQGAKAAGAKPGIGPKDLIVVSSNCFKEGIDAVRKGELYSTATQIPTVAGRRTVEAMVDFFN